YYASGRMWYFVDLSPPGDLNEPPILSRPMRSFDALALSAVMTLALGTPPAVFGVSNTMETLGKMAGGYVRTTYEAEERIQRKDGEILLVMYRSVFGAVELCRRLSDQCAVGVLSLAMDAPRQRGRAMNMQYMRHPGTVCPQNIDI